MSQNSKSFQFVCEMQDSRSQARVGKISTPHGSFETPVFMPVGTQATVKGVLPRDLQEAGSEIILSNAYHLYIRPGIDIIQEFGGLHSFMGWKGPILTDSGGFQVFSLSRFRQISEDGVLFYSHVDGKEIMFTPEKVVEIQEAIGSDIAMIFDECPPPTQDKARVKKAVDLTLAWARRAKTHHRRKEQALFGIVQGGVFSDLRKESLERTVEIGFDGYALGGLCVGESKAETLQVFDDILPEMPADKPRYLMGIGTPLDFLESIERGADMFDCVTPTRYGRNATAFTRSGLLVVRNNKYQRDNQPLDDQCGCYTCQNFSRGYLRHLSQAQEMLGCQLLSLHNIYFFVNFVKEIRQKIREGTFVEFKKNFINQFDPVCR